MANCYTTYADVKAYLGITGTGDDALLKSLVERASRMVDRYCGRTFYYRTETRKYDWSSSYRLWLDDDLISVSQLTDGQGVAIAAADFMMYPANAAFLEQPYLWIELDKGSGAIFTYDTSPQQAITVAGNWGFSDETEDSGDTVQDDPLTAAATILNVTDGTSFAVQETLVIESEQLFVTAISANALTVERRKNGSTAAQHAKATAINKRVYPRDVVQACVRLAAFLYKQKDAQTFGRTGFLELGIVEVPAAIPEDVRAVLNRYKRAPTTLPFR